MKVLYGPDFQINEDTAVAIGKFDGLHAGHRAILETLLSEAQKDKLKTVVYTFLQNPRIILENKEIIPLMDNETKTEELRKFGVNYLIYENFNEDFAAFLPEDFVKDILVRKMCVKLVVMGINSTFGKDGSGNIEKMKELGDKFGFKVKCIELISNNGEIISSSQIRESIFKENC